MKKKNIVFMLVDAFRPANMGIYGYDKPTTPNIDKLAKESLVFDNFFSTANATDPCVTSIFTGRYPWINGIYTHALRMEHPQIQNFLKKNNPWLPEILNKNGYATASLDWLGRFHKRGFDYYMGMNPHRSRIKKIVRTLNKFRARVFYENGEFITTRAIEFIKENKEKPFFTFVHFWDTHTPYNPPKKYLNQFRKINYTNKTFKDLPNTIHDIWIKQLKIKNLNEIFARYDGTIKYVDEQIGKMIHFLKDEGLYEDTIIIVTADHGENLIEHGVLFGHGEVYDTTINIPLIMRVPGVKPKRVEALVQQLDLFPTLLDYAGIKNKDKINGISFWNRINSNFESFRKYIVATHVRGEKLAYRDITHKFITTIDKNQKELYDISNDKDEKINIISNDNYKEFEKKLVENNAFSINSKSLSIIQEQKKRLKINKTNATTGKSVMKMGEVQKNKTFTGMLYLNKMFTLGKMFLKRPLGILISFPLTSLLWLLFIFKIKNQKITKTKENNKRINPSKLLSVVIVNWNCEKILEEALKAACDDLPKNSEIIVVDNASYDSSVEMIKQKFPKVKIIKNKHNVGFAKANNQAFAIAKGKYIMALNPDAIVTKGTFNELIRIMETKKDVGSVGPKLMNLTKRRFIDSTGHALYENRFAGNIGHKEVDKGQYKSRYVFGVCAAAALYRREMLEDIKVNGEYFDSDYFAYFEDVDLDWRMQRAGWKSYFTDKAIVHHYRELLSNHAFRHKMSVRNRYLTMIKNDSFADMMKDFFSIFPAEVYYNSVHTKTFLKVYLEVLKLMPKMIAKRREFEQNIGSPKKINKWFTKFNLKNETVNNNS